MTRKQPEYIFPFLIPDNFTTHFMAQYIFQSRSLLYYSTKKSFIKNSYIDFLLVD